MLLQELVSTLLKPNVPPGWEMEMEAAGLVSSIGSGNERAEETQSDNSEDEETRDEPTL